ncbi:MAG TPA: glycosyltransferase [Acidimicrobiales bacterium]|nr:glycosyltransferase [Acidimicrobiales bacterium]
MPTVLFVTWDGGGNVNPVLALGPRLAAQGLTPVGFGPPSLAPRFAAAGVAYVSREAADPWDVAAMAADVRAECRRAAASLAVVDYMLPGALVGAEAALVPAVALVHTLYGALLGDGDFPGPMAMAATVEALDAAARALGAAPVAGLADLLDRCARVLVACPASLDACPERWAANVRHVGPVLEAAGDDTGWSPPPGDGPLVAVSLGTTPMDEAPVLQGVLDGLAGEPVRVAVAVGAHLDASALDLPANAAATGYVRHAAVLPHAAAGVNHGGLGTVLATLAHGVPQVCIPLGREQPHNARAVAERGVGLAVDPAAGGEAVRDAVRQVLGEPRYREAAATLASSIARPGEPSPAEAEILAVVR